MKALALERFRELVDAYGTELSRFPEAEREPARALLEQSPEARALVSAESALDACFAEVALPELSKALERRLLEVPLRAPERRAWWPFTTRWIPALSWMAAAAMGVWLGTVLPEDDAAGSAETTAASQEEPDGPGDEDSVLAIAAGEYADLWGGP